MWALWQPLFVHGKIRASWNGRCWSVLCKVFSLYYVQVVKSDVRLTGVEIWPFPFRKLGHIIWGTCKGRLGEPQKKETGGTEGGRPLELAH